MRRQKCLNELAPIHYFIPMWRRIISMHHYFVAGTTFSSLPGTTEMHQQASQSLSITCAHPHIISARYSALERAGMTIQSPETQIVSCETKTLASLPPSVRN